MTIDTTHYERCIHSLERAHTLLLQVKHESVDYEMYHSACIKEFEIILEQSGKLLRRLLKPYFHSPKEVDKLHFKDVFRQTTVKNLIAQEVCERWLEYRDNCNNTAHDYGKGFAEETLMLLPEFVLDARHLIEIIKNQSNAT